MKVIAAAALVAAVIVGTPAIAQDRDTTARDRDNASKMQDRDNAANTHDRNDASMHHRISHRRATYKRNYKTDDEERQATEDLNRQYRGVPRSEAH
jgi:hypothetical protein